MNYRPFLLMIIFFLTGLTGFSQWYNPDKVSKKVNAINEKAYSAAIDGNYKLAISLLNDAIAADARFVDGYLSRAGIHAELRDYASSVKDFEKGFQLDAEYSKTYLLPFSISLAGIGEFERALSAVNEFLQTPRLNEQSIRAGNHRKKTYEFAIKYGQDHPEKNYVFTPANVSAKINSKHLEYYPALTIDGNKMIFTRRINNDEDFYESDLVNGTWSEAKPLGGRINTNFNEAAQTLSQDGDLLIYTGCKYPEGMGECDLYVSYKMKNGSWTEPENMGRRINTEFWESSPSLSPDKQELYFSSSRPGGMGGTDIWISRKQPDGKWGVPVNAGPEINSSGEEACPFIHADNQTLYFNSTGRPGYGSTDLFVSRRNAENKWETAVNLGYPINTIDDEGSLMVAADGITAYYASDRGNDNMGGLDIFTFKMRKDISALKTIWVKGKVYDKKTGTGLPSSVELTELDTRKVLSRLQTDEEGNYLVTLPEGKNYAFNVNRKGYLFYSENFAMQKTMDSALVIDIPLQPIETGAEIVLRNIFYKVNDFTLDPQSYEELDRVVELMKDNPKLRIQISGHTDNVGKPADNLTLSINRAKSVMNYLVTQGIAANRVTHKGFGETKPVTSNDTEAGKSRNRRTELNVIAVQ